MKVKLLDYTGKGMAVPADYAAAMLILAKSTRLNMSPELFEEIVNWSRSRKMEELQYIANTIPGAWEFCDFTFMIEGVSRGFTHQFVRSRTWSFAQQTMRVLDVGKGLGWSYKTGPTIAHNPGLKANYDATMDHIARAYRWLIDGGATVEDARDVLPTAIHTNIMGKANFRNVVDLARTRVSSRVQGEYRDVIAAMKAEIVRAYPWAELFLSRTFDNAAAELNDLLDSGFMDEVVRMKALKLLDLMRGQS